MSPLTLYVGAGVLALLALIALRGKRWAYLAFVLLGLLYFPAQTHFRVHAPKCEQILPTLQLLVPLLHNYAYIALFAGFYWLSWVQFGRSDARGVWALVATLLVAALVELAEGMTGGGRGQVHCRVRDLVPDAAGAVGAALLLAVRGVHAEMGLRGKIEEPEQHEREVGPALAAQGDKGEEGEDARTDVKG